MSLVFQRRGRWYVDFSDERGRRVRKVLDGIASKRAAEGELAELVAKARRRELGLEAAPASVKSTVWELCAWWLKYRCPKQSIVRETSRLTLHVRDSELGQSKVAMVRKGDFELFLSSLEASTEKRKPLSASSVNHLRAKLRTVFERARREDVFSGPNPVADTRRRRQQKRLHQTLTVEEVPRMLAMTPVQWRGFFAIAVYMGLRKGEVAGLLKGDVDLVAGTLRVGRSYQRDTTKGGHVDLLPIPSPALPHVELALKSPGPYLFPDAKGRPRKAHAAAGKRLRAALIRAHLVDGYRLICRKCAHDKKPFEKLVAELPAKLEKCPQCGRQKLWAKPVPRHVRFHDLRHTTATILLRAGVAPHHVQRILRHASVTTTTATYAHLNVEDLRGAMESLYPKEVDPKPAQTPEHQVAPRREGAST